MTKKKKNFPLVIFLPALYDNKNAGKKNAFLRIFFCPNIEIL